MFFITGLPRSRTAWLANLFTYKNSFCFHEISRIGSDPYLMMQKMRSRREDHVGSADQMAPYYVDFMVDRTDNMRLIVINRDKEEVKDSLASWIGERNTEINRRVDALDKKLKTMMDRHPHKLVNYEDLDDPEVIKSMWYYCLPSVTFDEDRYKMLQEFNVQLIRDKYLHKLDGDETSKLMEA